jgi:hypothetical protein
MGGAFRGAITGTGFYGIGRGFARISKGISGNFKSYSPRIKKSPTYNGTKKPMLKINLGFFGEKSSNTFGNRYTENKLKLYAYFFQKP